MNQQHLRAIAALPVITNNLLGAATRGFLAGGDATNILHRAQVMQEISVARNALHDKFLLRKQELETLEAQEARALEAAAAEAEEKFVAACEPVSDEEAFAEAIDDEPYGNVVDPVDEWETTPPG